MRTWIKYPLFIIGLLMIIFLIFPHAMTSFFFNYEIDYARKKILYQTDYQKLLEAGREVLSKAKVDKKVWMGDRYYSFYKLPTDIKIPKVIQRLKLIGSPSISIPDEYLALIVDISNRSSYVQVVIYPKDFNEPEKYFFYGNKKLLHGLWYNDEEYHYDPNGYDKIINSIMKTGKYPPAEKSIIL